MEYLCKKRFPPGIDQVCSEFGLLEYLYKKRLSPGRPTEFEFGLMEYLHKKRFFPDIDQLCSEVRTDGIANVES